MSFIRITRSFKKYAVIHRIHFPQNVDAFSHQEKKVHERRQKGNKTRTKIQAKDKDELAVSQLGQRDDESNHRVTTPGNSTFH